MDTLKVLGICGSLRWQSTNLGLLRYAQQNAPADLEIKIADLTDVPFYQCRPFGSAKACAEING